jgi:hypothetical protein
MIGLLELNKNVLHDKLSKLKKYNDLYVAKDLIDILSDQKERDTRVINEFTDEEIKVHTVRRKSGLKSVRLFTAKGIERYLHEGKLFDYQNACSYFNVPAKDKVAESYSAFLSEIYDSTTKKYNTKKILKWLFEKRKMCKSLGDYTTLGAVISIFKQSPDVVPEKLKFIQKLAGNL